MLSSALDLLGGGASRPSRWQVGMQSGARSSLSGSRLHRGEGIRWGRGCAAHPGESTGDPPPLPATSTAGTQACLGQGSCPQGIHSFLGDPEPRLRLGCGSISERLGRPRRGSTSGEC